MQEIKVGMQGLQGYKKIDIPSNYQYQYRFITIVNITDNSVCLYPGNVTTPQAGASIVCAGPYSSITIPIPSELLLGFNVVWTNPTGSNLDKIKVVKLIFSEENLNYNASFAPSFTAGGDVVNTAIVADDIGIAKATQLPSALSSSGNLKVAVQEALPAGNNTIGGVILQTDNIGLAKSTQLPASLTAGGNLKTAIMEALPAGNNLIGLIGLPGTEITLLASETRTTSGDTSGTPVDVKKFKEGNFFLDITAVSGTTPTLDIAIKTKDPVSGKWFTIVQFTQATAIGSEMKTVGNLGSLIAVFYTIGGTSPSFTFSVGAVLK